MLKRQKAQSIQIIDALGIALFFTWWGLQSPVFGMAPEIIRFFESTFQYIPACLIVAESLCLAEVLYKLWIFKKKIKSVGYDLSSQKRTYDFLLFSNVTLSILASGLLITASVLIMMGLPSLVPFFLMGGFLMKAVKSFIETFHQSHIINRDCFKDENERTNHKILKNLFILKGTLYLGLVLAFGVSLTLFGATGLGLLIPAAVGIFIGLGLTLISVCQFHYNRIDSPDQKLPAETSQKRLPEPLPSTDKAPHFNPSKTPGCLSALRGLFAQQTPPIQPVAQPDEGLSSNIHP